MEWNDPRTERYQWMRNREGGQEYGNQQVVTPLSRELFDTYAAPLVRDELRDWDRYSRAHPGLWISLISQDRGASWKVTRIGDEDTVRPSPPEPRWMLRVDAFDSAEAVRQGSTADSDASRRRARVPGGRP